MKEINGRQINDAVLNYINGGTKEQNEELQEYARRHYPDYDKYDPKSAVAFFIMESYKLRASRMSDNPDIENLYLIDGQTVDHATMMSMLREIYGD